MITNPHFSQYRVSRDSLPTQSSNLGQMGLAFWSKISSKHTYIFWFDVHWFQKTTVMKHSPKLMFLNKKIFSKRIQMILDIKNWLWKSYLGTFRVTIKNWTEGFLCLRKNIFPVDPCLQSSTTAITLKNKPFMRVWY